eukprot:TRINITY_DN12781_c0_g1_i1.p1 TRINITY_DN12781_c0_g1~~TRINITY_DN12781_c0_g1_i1.p1  ORF type:complete len:172 (+),score=28.72 TRINITY_DN12781_c0_g1_i1:280-795(+)
MPRTSGYMNKRAHKLRKITENLNRKNEYASKCYNLLKRPGRKPKSRRPLTFNLLVFCRTMINMGFSEYRTPLSLYSEYDDELRHTPDIIFNFNEDSSAPNTPNTPHTPNTPNTFTDNDQNTDTSSDSTNNEEETKVQSSHSCTQGIVILPPEKSEVPHSFYKPIPEIFFKV